MNTQKMIAHLKSAGYSVGAPHCDTLTKLENTVVCEACGGELYYVEFVPSYRHVKALRDGVVVVSGIAEDDVSCAERAHLECMRCFAKIALPALYTFE